MLYYVKKPLYTLFIYTFDVSYTLKKIYLIPGMRILSSKTVKPCQCYGSSRTCAWSCRAAVVLVYSPEESNKCSGVYRCLLLLLRGVMFQTFKLMSAPAPAGLAREGGAAIPAWHCKCRHLSLKEGRKIMILVEASQFIRAYSTGGWAGLRHACD